MFRRGACREHAREPNEPRDGWRQRTAQAVLMGHVACSRDDIRRRSPVREIEYQKIFKNRFSAPVVDQRSPAPISPLCYCVCMRPRRPSRFVELCLPSKAANLRGPKGNPPSTRVEHHENERACEDLQGNSCRSRSRAESGGGGGSTR